MRRHDPRCNARAQATNLRARSKPRRRVPGRIDTRRYDAAAVDREESLSPEHLRELLASSLSRLERFTDLNTVDVIIDHERKHALDLIAKMEPSDAEAVRRAFPRGAKLLERGSSDSRPERDDNRPN